MSCYRKYDLSIGNMAVMTGCLSGHCWLSYFSSDEITVRTSDRTAERLPGNSSPPRRAMPDNLRLRQERLHAIVIFDRGERAKERSAMPGSLLEA